MATITLTKSGIASSDWGEVQPLTTVWTPPPGCPSVVQIQDVDYYNKHNTTGQSCAPPNYRNVWWENGYYSPGKCPFQYSTAMTLGPGHSLNGNWIESSQTAAICVPSGYTIWPHYAENYTIWAGLSVVSPATGGRTWDGTSRVPAFEIRWALSDLPLLADATGTASLPFSFTTGIPTPTVPSSSLPDTAATTGLSRGTIAGIAVGVVVALGLIIAVLSWLFLRRYRRERLKRAGAELETGSLGGQQIVLGELPVEKTESHDSGIASGAATAVPFEKQINKDDAAVAELDAKGVLPTTRQPQHLQELEHHVGGKPEPVPRFEKQTEKDDTAAVEVSANVAQFTGGRPRHPPELEHHIGNKPEPPTELADTRAATVFEMDNSPTQRLPTGVHYAAELPLNTLKPVGPSELHAANEETKSTSTPAVEPPAVNDNTDSEVAKLLERKARVEERRRALELQQLEAEAAAIESRLSQLGAR
ncbi:hypothetical protein QBC47DRAFT_430631 [Echria macrotheca]|uniref:Uncharacterized protein n=1 Tax=Echria macrotheca TaxID=438768 RepID=A0AAJ0F7V2_9PEZI|nr:hypothetical protein QBC47DRAFT_430631 [Echria macrotheca]